MDQLDIPAGARWNQAIGQALKSCGRLLVILSPASASSENVLDEIAFAQQKNKPIIPLLYQACEIPLFLTRVQYLDFTYDYRVGLDNLLNNLLVSAVSKTFVKLLLFLRFFLF